VSGFEAPYSRTERMLHDLAMGQIDLQQSLSGLEDRTIARAFTALSAERPVFITSLPRAGTTLTLEVLCEDPVFVTHTYRNMPFLLCPVFWDRMSRGFRKAGAARERAHGDGMSVSYDSVEAFEEVIWRQFWPDHYQPDRITPWTADETDTAGAFVAFLRGHMRKLVGLARGRRGDDAPARYVSKNNGNVARLAFLTRAMPDATVLAMFREPLAHVGSLLHQHENFLALHASDAFARRYMESIGHYDFGGALRPIDFDGWRDGAGAGLSPLGADFWAEYWIAAFTRALAQADEGVRFVSYDRLCAAPQAGLATLADAIGLAASSPVRGQGGRFRAPTPYAAERLGLAPERLERAQALHARLLARSIV